MRYTGHMDEKISSYALPYRDAAEHIAHLLSLMDGLLEGDASARDAFFSVMEKEDASLDEGILLPFAYLCAIFSLSPMERLLLLCALRGNIPLDMALSAACGTAEDSMRQYELLARNQAPLSLLLAWGEDGLPISPLTLRPRVSHYLLDPDSPPLFESILLWPEEMPPLTFGAEAQEALLRASSLGGVAYIEGAKGYGKRTQARHLAAALNTPILLANLADSPSSDELALECLLRGAIPCLTNAQSAADPPYLLERRIDTLKAWFPFVLVLGEESPPSWLQGAMHIPLPLPTSTQRLSLWQQAVQGVPLAKDADLAALAGKFSMSPGQIHDAAKDALTSARIVGETLISDAALHAACRRQMIVRLSGRARRVEPRSRLADLVLPQQQLSLLHTAIDQVRCWNTVYGDWGLEGKIPYGRGLSMLFSGPPGTGKTMAAQVVAAELMMDLYQVDLSGIVSKYVGETEQNLSRVFDEVAAGQGILFFDEADALFGKRTEVKDAQDRYANMEASYLLQRIEAYEGIVILATNIFQNFDDAFRRRIKFVIDFPFPDRPLREAIWENALPDTVPKDTMLDYRFLSRFELSGSYIRNISVNAAFLAAAQGQSLAMRHMLSALRIEIKKAGKALLKEDLGAYYYELEQEE